MPHNESIVNVTNQDNTSRRRALRLAPQTRIVTRRGLVWYASSRGSRLDARGYGERHDRIEKSGRIDGLGTGMTFNLQCMRAVFIRHQGDYPTGVSGGSS